MHGFRGLPNGGDDSGMRSAAADISLQGLYDFRFVGICIFLQERDAADNHSRCAVRTLECALIEKCLLHRMELAVLFEALNGDDGFSGGVGDRELAGPARRAIQQNCARATLAFAASVFGSGKAKLFAQRKKQCGLGIRLEGAALSVNLCVEWPCHVISRVAACD